MVETDRAEVHETHSAVVLLAGDRAYKIKKPVDLGFLDFSTVERRAEACRDELRLNRRLAPDVYLGTATLVDDATRRPLEHAVVMRRLPSEATLAARIQGGEAVGASVRAVAQRLGAFHTDNAVDPALAEIIANPAALQQLWDGCTTRVRRSGAVPGALADDVAARAKEFIAGRGELFSARIVQGFVRDGHGDLQASDVFVLDDAVHLIDCLDFDERLRIGDVAGDVGFLAMDLERLGRPDLARLLIEEHARASGLATPPALQHFYVAYRAWVRCAVACVREEQGENAGEIEQLATLALVHLRMAGPQLVVVSGLPASGKSTLARRIVAERPDWLLLRSDLVRDDVVPRAPDRYDVGARSAVYDAMLRSAAAALALGTSVVLDATFTETCWRDKARATAADSRARLVVLECVAPLEIALARVRARASTGTDASEVTVEALHRLATAYKPWPGALQVTTGTGDAPIDDAVTRLLQLV